MLRKVLLATVFSAGLTASAFAADKYTFDPSHSQIIFSYNHLGFSTTSGMYSGFTGEAMLDQDKPENSSVSVSMKATDMIAGWEKRKGHFMSADFFNAEANPDVSFKSTKVEATGEKTATNSFENRELLRPALLRVPASRQPPAGPRWQAPSTPFSAMPDGLTNTMARCIRFP